MQTWCTVVETYEWVNATPILPQCRITLPSDAIKLCVFYFWLQAGEFKKADVSTIAQRKIKTARRRNKAEGAGVRYSVQHVQ